MLQVISALDGYGIEATDGRIGTVSDFLFDDRTWQIRWLVVDTGGWLSGRKVLIQPSAIGRVDHLHQQLPLALTRAQIEESPDILADQPVSSQMEFDLYGHYGWDPAWGGSYFGGNANAIALPMSSAPFIGAPALDDAAVLPPAGDPHLQSAEDVAGYHIQASDGAIGHIESFIIDDADWDIRYLIIDTRNWWPGEHVLVSPYAVQAIHWADRQIEIGATRAEVRDSPPWNPHDLIDQDYEKQLHSHYHWPGYGW
jgi:hypothetical protein